MPLVMIGQLISFPETAKGFGRFSAGGRGGAVLFVTNLNNSGAGSLRTALEASGARTVVFRVGGTITLTSDIQIHNPFVTIAGETAPGDGIMIRGHDLQISTNDVIIRHVRFRPDPVNNTDAIRIVSTDADEVYNIMIDHCSMSFAGDENMGIGATGTNGIVRDITVQNSILGDAPYGTLVSHRTYDVTFYNNYLTHNNDRNIRIGGYADQAEPRFALRAEFINNIVYDPGSVTTITYGQKYAAYGNKYKLANGQTMASGRVFEFTTSGEYAGYRPNSEIYTNDNILEGAGVLEATNIAAYKQGTPFNSSGIVAVAANTLESFLLNEVGAFPLDAVDQGFIANYSSGAQQGTRVYPTINGGTAYTDTDNDGMEDSWENTTFGNLNQTHLTDFDGDGYTDLEEFLHYKAGYVASEVGNPLPTVTRKKMRIGTTRFPFFYLGTNKILN